MTDRISTVASNVSYGASGGTTGIGLITANEMVALAGLFLAFATFIINAYYKHKHYQLAKASHDAALRSAGNQGSDQDGDG